MDPRQAVIDMLELLKARDTEAAREKLEDLCEWINKGGYVPLNLDRAILLMKQR